MRTVLFIPPLSRMSGGLANLYRIAVDLRELGHAVALVCPGGKAASFDDLVRQGFEILPWEGLRLDPADLWVLPEGWPNAIVPGVTRQVPTLVYAQSWNFLLTSLPEGVRWERLPVRFLAVSRPVAWFLEEVLGVPVCGLLPPALDPVFVTAEATRSARSDCPATCEKGAVRVACMPRKNRALAEQVRQVALARLARAARREDAPPVEWVAVQNMPLPEVARVFSSCHIFLNTAFPEGFGLPPLEAMACGCVPVGFTGFGGWEYMRQALPGAYAPPFAFGPGGGNGLFFADGDIMAAGLGLAEAIRMAAANEQPWRDIVRNGRETAARYSREAGKETLARIWQGLSA